MRHSDLGTVIQAAVRTSVPPLLWKPQDISGSQALMCSHTVSLLEAFQAGDEDLLSTRSIHLISDHVFKAQPLLLEDRTRSSGTSATTPHFSLEQNGSFYRPWERKLLDPSSPASGAPYTPRGTHVEHADNAGASLSGEYAFTEAKAKTLGLPDESTQGSNAVQASAEKETPPNDDASIANVPGETVNSDALSTKGEVASTTAPTTTDDAESSKQVQRDVDESRDTGADTRGGYTDDTFWHEAEPCEFPADIEPKNSPAAKPLPEIAPFSTASITTDNAAQPAVESALPEFDEEIRNFTAKNLHVADEGRIPQAGGASLAGPSKPILEKESNMESYAEVLGDNGVGQKSGRALSVLKGIKPLTSTPAAESPSQFVELHAPAPKSKTTAVESDSESKEHQISNHDVKGNQPLEKKLARKPLDLSKHETQNLVDPEGTSEILKKICTSHAFSCCPVLGYARNRRARPPSECPHMRQQKSQLDKHGGRYAAVPVQCHSALAQKVRKFVGLRAGSNLHLETQNLIEKNCDLSTFGPAYCASKANPNAEALLWSLEHRKNTTCFVIALVTLAFGVIVQTLIRILEHKISQGKDEFSKEVMETAFRQIATISIVNVLLWGVMQSNLASVLDQLIFGDVIPKERDSDAVLENVSPMLEVLFEELFFVAVILLVWYVLYVLIFQCMTRQLIDWMRRVDEESDIPEVARQAEIQRQRCCGWIFGRTAIDKANFIAHRYEFGDNVQSMSVPGVDPTGYYFMEYLRAALLRMAIEMIRLPNSTLIFLMFVGICLRPVLSFRLTQEVALISTLSAMCLLSMLLVWAYVYRIERQLRPRHIPQYLVLRYHMDVGGHPESYIEQFTPAYKLQKQKDTWPGLMSLIYGTTLPNKHQQLFCFWANGPALVLRALEATFFCQLLVLAWWVQLVRTHPATWFRYCWWANLVVGACAILQFGLLKHVVYTVLVALNSGLLIEPELLEKVWDMQRAENMRLIADLTDALRLQSTLYAISEGGDIFWRQLLIRSKSASRQVQEQRLSIWAGLDEEHQGEINREKVFRYLSSQGLPLKTEVDASDFLHVFDRDGKGGLNEDEFFVLVMIVKQILMEPLDKDALRALFENEYGIPWTSAVGIDMATLSKILTKLHLVWSEGKKRYLFDFVGGRRGTVSVSPDQFVTSLQAMDEQATQPFQVYTKGVSAAALHLRFTGRAPNRSAGAK